MGWTNWGPTISSIQKLTMQKIQGIVSMIFLSNFNWVVKEPYKINSERIDYSKYFCDEKICNKYIFISLCCEFIMEKIRYFKCVSHAILWMINERMHWWWCIIYKNIFAFIFMNKVLIYCFHLIPFFGFQWNFYVILYEWL